MKILVLDTETTGLDLTKHEIIQIGFLSIKLYEDDTYKIMDECELKIRPLHIELASPQALVVNGYNESDWKDSLIFSDHSEKIKNYIENCDLLLGQNLIFDLRFIKQTFANFNLEPPKFPGYGDTRSLAGNLLKENKIRSASMDNLCNYYNIQNYGKAHTALVDCKRTFDVWRKLCEDVEDVNFYTFENPYDPYANKTK